MMMVLQHKHTKRNRGNAARAIAYAVALAALIVCAASPARCELSKDANGWSVLTPSNDSRLIYVSSVSGNDATGVAYSPSNPLIGSDPFHPVGAIMPFATYSAAYAQTRDGYPDWVLFKRGETWTTGLSGIRNGRSDTERMVITSYGTSSDRPVFKTGASSFLNLIAGSGGRYWIQYIAIVGLHAYDSVRDPGSADFGGYVNGPTGISLYATHNNGYQGVIRNILIEDCHVEWYSDNLCAQAGTDADNAGYNLTLRRNIINNAYDIDTAHRAQGMYCAGFYNVTLEENVFDHNGWYVQGSGGYDGSGGKATVYNHNTYFGGVHDVTFSGNMFLRASSIGTKWCHENGGAQVYDILLDNNLYVEGEIGAQIGGNGNEAYGFADITVTNNVLEALGRTQTTGRGTIGWGFWIKDWDGGTIEDNLFIRQDNTTNLNVFAIMIDSGVSARDITIDGNVIYQMCTSGQLVSLANKYLYSNISFTNNVVDSNTYTSQMVNSTSNTLVHYTLDNNKYYSGAAASAWFKIAGVNKSFAQWQSLAGEPNSTTGHGTFADATRTVETYDTAQSGDGTFAHFINQAKAQSKASWNTAWTAGAVNDYIRAGFASNLAPSFTANPFTKSAATQDAAYSGSISGDASDPDAGNTLTFSKQSGPAWLSVASDGTLSGTPTNANVGANQFTVRVTDQGGLYDDATMNITVINVNDSPVFVADPITKSNATEDSAYSGSLAADASDPDAGDTLTFSKQSGPAWLTVASNGALSGTPTNANVGANQFTVRVTDAGGLYDDATLNVTVINVNDAPAWNANPFTKTAATQGTAYSGSIAGDASDVDAGDTLTFSKQSGPAWLSVASNGAFSGTPAAGDVGANAFTVRVTDASSAYADATMNITVGASTPTQVTFVSVGSEDGYVVESSQGSGVGNVVSGAETSSNALRIGDTATNQQYKTILSFDTSSIPDTATITSATLYLTGGGRSGTNPWTILGTCYVDIKGGSGFNGSTTLEAADFQAAADATQVATVTPNTFNGQISKAGLTSGLNYIDKTGKTQLRIYMSTATNANSTQDSAHWWSGECSTTGNRPRLVVVYQ